jgi:transposase
MSQNNSAFKDWKEIRRKRALELKQQGWKQRQIAAALGVTAAAVSQWVNSASASAEAWRAKPQGHRPPKLTDEELCRIPDLLSHGAETYGFRGQLWTCARVAEVLREEFEVSYHKAHVSRLLKALKWTPQMPMERASQRDEKAIENWRVEIWPALKKRGAQKA